jgi:hypothetical protein
MTPIGARGAWIVLGTLGVLIAIDVPELGSDPWPFHGAVHPHGVFARLVRAAGSHWDLGFVRTPGIVAGFLVAIVALAGRRRTAWGAEVLVAVSAVVLVALLVPAVVLQAGLRQSSQRWQYVNDSTYQIELAGDLVRHGHDPYGRDYTGSGLERWYPAAGFPLGRRPVALRHLAYFPGTPLTAAAWDVLPRPFDDYRFFVLLCTFALFGAAFVFHAPLALRIALGAALAANPLAVRAVWFGTADAPSLLLLVLAFAFLSRHRPIWSSFLLGASVLLKQFTLVAVPFFVVLLVFGVRPPRAVLRNAAAAFLLPLVAGTLPFLVADPGVGYGLSSLFLRAGWVDGRYSSYPFVWLLLLVWLPVTAWLLWNLRRGPQLWTAAAGFAVSMFTLVFISRVFQTSYLVWPFDAILVAALLANAHDERRRAPPDVARQVDGSELQPITTRP